MISIKTNEENWKHGVLLFYTLILIAGFIALSTWCFIWFAFYNEEKCILNIILMSVTCGMYIVIFALRLRKDSSIFTSALICIWITFLLWSAMASIPEL